MQPVQDILLSPNLAEGIGVQSSSTVPETARPPLAFLDPAGQVIPHQAGDDIHPERVYLYTRDEVMRALDAYEVKHAGVAPTLGGPVDTLPNLEQGLTPKTEPTLNDINAVVRQSQRDVVGMVAQFRDPAGRAIPPARTRG